MDSADPPPAEPVPGVDFDIVLRGYNRVQVNEYLGALAERAERQAKALDEAESQLAELRSAGLPAEEDTVLRENLSSLGVMVQNIVARAEHEASVRLTQAEESAAAVRAESVALRAEADRTVDEARRQHQQIVAQAEQSRVAVISGAESEAAEILSAAREEAEAIRAKAAAVSLEAETTAATTVKRAEQDAAAVIADARREAATLVKAAEDRRATTANDIRLMLAQGHEQLEHVTCTRKAVLDDLVRIREAVSAVLPAQQGRKARMPAAQPEVPKARSGRRPGGRPDSPGGPDRTGGTAGHDGAAGTDEADDPSIWPLATH